MRYWQFGIFNDQWADIDGETCPGRSILVWSNTTDYSGTPLYSGEDYLPCMSNMGSNDIHYQIFMNVVLDQIKAKLGQIPVLLRVDLELCAYSDLSVSTNPRFDAYRMYNGWDIGDSTNRYRDTTGLITWYQDAYSPYPGQDRESDPSYSSYIGQVATNEKFLIEVTSIVERALRDNVDIKVMLHGDTDGASALNIHWDASITTRRPNLQFFYMYPIEFYESVGGALDLTSTVQEAEDGHYYLGAVERGATGVATQGWVRNYTPQTKQVEIFDDHPEWMTPVQRTGTGTGLLDYVTLADSATSQLYTIQFYSTTAYEVKAESYRDNSIGYHPQYDANGSWRSDVSSTWNSPSGGLTITAAMWQSALINSGDEFEVAVRGNTTDTAWPADSNDQVEITYDNAGAADATGWRPALGRREKTTAAVDVDATSKFFPLRHITPADWPTSTKCFIHDQDNIDEGTITSTQERALASATHTGSGLDDCTSSGNYNGNADYQYRIVIDATGTPDTFSWSRTGDATYIATGVSITGAAQLLENGVYVTFAATTGHTLADRWDFDADTWGVTVGSLTSGSNSYNTGAVVATTLPIRDLAPAKWTTVSAASGASQAPASRIYLSSTTSFTQGDIVFVQQAATTDTYELATIATGGVTSTYIDLTSSLLSDYIEGDFCTVTGTGEDAFWMRPVATAITVEELKRLRFNARIL